MNRRGLFDELHATRGRELRSKNAENMKNMDERSVASFGDEWSRFDQSQLSESEAQQVFLDYFRVFPWDEIPRDASGFDMGCGTGRWARLVAPRVGHLHCIDPSAALEVAKRNLEGQNNVSFHRAGADDHMLPESSQDFGYSLGVLHHVPDTRAALQSCIDMLKPGAPFLLYLYYALDNRPFLFRMTWKLSNIFRIVISRLPSSFKRVVTDVIALVVYLPLARLASLVEGWGFNVSDWPLSYYRGLSFYTMRTDSRDRFGTPLEKRFTIAQIRQMMEDVGLRNIRVSDRPPYWCCVGFKGD